MMCLFQYCDHCKKERNFDPETLRCKICNKTNKKSNHENKNKNSKKG